MNKWKQFAEIFGLELNEEFKIKDVEENKDFGNRYKFNEEGLKYFNNYVWLREDDEVLIDLINGTSKAVEIPYKPKFGEKYYYCRGDVVSSYFWEGDAQDIAIWKTGNCFRTEEEAKTKGKEIAERIIKEYESIIQEKTNCSVLLAKKLRL